MADLQCANCDAPIGRLETPYLWKEHVVCAACYQKLASAAAPAPAPLLSPEDIVKSDSERAKKGPAKEEVLFREDGVEITRAAIRWPDGSLAMNQVLSLASRTPFLSTGYIVDVRDLVERKFTFKLKNKDSASRFIGAIKSANGSVNIDRDSMSWFFILEG